MTPLSAPDHLLAAVLAVFFPIRSFTFGYRRLVRAADEDMPRVRRGLYRQAIAIQWTLAALTVLLWRWRARPWVDLGLVWRTHAGSIALAAAFLLLVTVTLLQLPRALRDADTLARVRQKLSHVQRLLPRGPDERRLFSAMALTAGICEELLYRGYLIWYLGHMLPTLAAAAVAVLLFGIGHSYQGPRGMVQTTVVGAVMALFYFGSQSLYLPMVAHAAMDLYAGFISSRALEGAEVAGAPAGSATP